MSPESIPMPPRRTFTRLALPAAVLLAAVGTLVAVSWRSLLPLPTVPVAAVALMNSSAPTGAPSTHGAIQAPGWVEPMPFPFYATSLVPGVVKELLVLEGDPVEADQVVAQLYPESFQAELELATAQEQATAALVEGRRAELLRKEGLVEVGSVSRGEVVQLKFEVAAAVAEHDAASAARNLAKLARERCAVRAPQAGVVMARLSSPGSTLGMDGEHGFHVLHLYDPASLQMRVDVPLSNAARLGVGQKAQVEFDALPNRKFDGLVRRLVHQADIAKNTVQVKVELLEPDPALKPEMLGRVRIFPGSELAAPTDGGASVSDASTVLMAPEAGIIRDGSGAAALVVANLREGVGEVERRTLTLGNESRDGFVAVLSGLRPGDLVLTDPQGAPSPGSRVRVLTSSPNGSTTGKDPHANH